MKLSTFSIKTALVVFVLIGADTRSEEVMIPIKPSGDTSTLQQLQEKADESDRYRAQYLTLRETLGEMVAMLPAEGATRAGYEGTFGQLSAVLEKAEQVDALIIQVGELKKEVALLQEQRDQLQVELEKAQTERDEVLESVQGLKDADEKWAKTVDGLRETIKRLLLGEFEYYEVKEGDTLQSIAANPMVYGDATRAAWLRQVNEGQIKHLDNLQPGEVLVIPLFPHTGSYEF